MHPVRNRVPILFIIVLLVPILAACGTDTASPTPRATSPLAAPPYSSSPVAGESPVASPVIDESPMASPIHDVINQSSPSASPVLDATPPPATAAASPVVHQELTPKELVKIQPNELGGIPIFMYHNIVTDPSKEGHLYRTVDEFYADLQWLYDRDFYLVGMNDVVRGQLDVPAGKHPVVLTFDDSSSMHLSWQMGPDGQPLKDENGEFMPTPNSAVGIIERFAAEHPDFGKTAHFSTIPVFKFSWPEYEQDEWYESKVVWLVNHGYEIGNHTSDHQDLTTMNPEDFARNLYEPYALISEMVDPKNPNSAMGILTLPYGAYPEGGWEGDQYWYLKDGFVYNGTSVSIEGVMLVCCGASPSVFNTEFSKLWIPRIRGDDPDFDRFGEEIDKGWVILYTSDGNPDTVTVPWPLPKSQWGKLDEDAVYNRGLSLVKYYPDNGRIFPVREREDKQGYNCTDEPRISA